MTLGVGQPPTRRGRSIGEKVISTDKSFTTNPISRKRAGKTGSRTLKKIGTGRGTRRKREREKARRKRIVTKSGHGLHTARRTRKASPRERVGILKKRMCLKARIIVTRGTENEKKVGRGIENGIMKRIEIDTTKTGTMRTEGKAKGKKGGVGVGK